MSIFDRLFRRGTGGEQATAGSDQDTQGEREVPVSLQLLFPETLALDPEAITASLRAFDPTMSQATCEVDPALAANGTPLGKIAWGDEVVNLIGFEAPMPAASVEPCVAAAHYRPDLKARARAHRAHVLLYHAGGTEDPLEKYVTLAAVAGVLSEHGALVVLNEAAHTSLPAAVLARDEDDEESALERLRGLPIPLLYVGFLKLLVAERDGVWMSTRGAHVLDLPDLAFHAEAHEQAMDTFEWFNAILSYLRDTGATLGPGHTMDVSAGVALRFRAPRREEGFLESGRPLLVVERIARPTA